MRTVEAHDMIFNGRWKKICIGFLLRPPKRLILLSLPDVSSIMQSSSCDPAVQVYVCTLLQHLQHPEYHIFPQSKAAQEVQYHPRVHLVLAPLQSVYSQGKAPWHIGKRSYFNFIRFLRIPFSKVKVSIRVSLEGTGVKRSSFLHSLPTVQSNHRPLLKFSVIICLNALQLVKENVDAKPYLSFKLSDSKLNIPLHLITHKQNHFN